MNSVKLQDKVNIEKPAKFPYTNNILSEKSRKSNLDHTMKKLRNKFNRGCERPVSRKQGSIGERN
jgi:hypothetical protein